MTEITDAYVTLNADETEVTGVFFSPQNPPQPEGYAVILSNDPRLIAFYNAQNNG